MDSNDIERTPAEPTVEFTAVEPTATVPLRSRGARRFSRRREAIIGSLLVAGGAGAALLGPLSARAESPSPSAVSSGAIVAQVVPGASEAPTASGFPGTGSGSTGAGSGTDANGSGASGSTGTRGPGRGGHGGPGGFGGHNEAVSDTSVAAAAIGISEADLLTALQGGQTMVDVAKAHSVDPQKVIDALVQDGLDELAAAVKAGTITQAQADAQKDQVTQRATDQANGTFRGSRGGHGG